MAKAALLCDSLTAAVLNHSEKHGYCIHKMIGHTQKLGSACQNTVLERKHEYESEMCFL